MSDPAGERQDEAALEDLSAHVRRLDPARWLAARFAPPVARSRLEALYAFHLEIARVREAVSEPMVGEIRLAWWREAVEELYDDRPNPRRHPIVLALARAFRDGARRAPDLAAFEAVIEARGRDLDDRPFATIQEVVDYAAATAGGLAALAATLVADADEAVDVEAARAAGTAWGLYGLARALPVHAATGRSAAPQDAVRATGRTVAQIVRDGDAEALRAVAAPLLDAAEEARARAVAAPFPATVWPAVGYAALTASGAARLRRGDVDPFAEATRAPGLSDRARLTWAALRGRV